MKPLPEDLARRDAVNAEFAAETSRFGFAYRCVSCVHVVPSSGACSLGYPNTLLRDADSPVISSDGRLAFCKYFELV
ncbi:MAG: hypothetical protein ACI9MR_001839 [Myxococcota bacterium]|jgi:hypothetical protein